MATSERLQFVISLLDKISAPLDKIQGRMRAFSERADAGFNQASKGAAGLVAAGYSVQTALGGGNDFMAGLGEVKSLGVAQDALDGLAKKSFDVAGKFNLNAGDVVRSAYDIQSAISGLQGDELGRITEASALLAKGTKSDSATITSYVGTMFGIFQNEANRMGKAEWVNMLSGQTATAVQIFKTTGSKMADSFTALGAGATTMGVQLNEQIGILGTLQATMGGGEAGTKYRAFLKGIGKAQEELGLKLTDAQGHALPMVSILEKIKGKFGNIDTVAKSDLMQKAFGSDEAVALVKLLSQNTDGLAASIEQLGQVKGAGPVAQMADAMLTPMDRMTGASKVLATQFSLLMNNAMAPLFERMAAGSQRMNKWLVMFPNLARWAAIGGLAIMGLVAGVSLFALVGGIATLASAGWVVATTLLSGVLGGLNVILGVLRIATLLFNVALWANPITWVVAGVIALVAAAALLYFKWDALKTAFMGTAWGQAIVGTFQSIGTWFTSAGEWFTGLGTKWDAFLEKIKNLSPLTALQNAMAAIGGVFGFTATAAPGAGAGGAPAALANPAAPMAARIPGGAGGQIANAMTSNNNSGTRIGELNITTSKAITPDEIAHLAQFHA